MRRGLGLGRDVVGHGGRGGPVDGRRGDDPHRRGGGRGRLVEHVGTRLRGAPGAPLGLRLGLGLVDDGVAAEAFGVGQTADAIGRGVVDARRVALDADLELLGEIEHHLVLDAELSRQLVDADLLRCQACCLCFLYLVLHAAATRCVRFAAHRHITGVQSRA
jgi:hypothetical protein